MRAKKITLTQSIRFIEEIDELLQKDECDVTEVWFTEVIAEHLTQISYGEGQLYYPKINRYKHTVQTPYGIMELYYKKVKRRESIIAELPCSMRLKDLFFLEKVVYLETQKSVYFGICSVESLVFDTKQEELLLPTKCIDYWLN